MGLDGVELIMAAEEAFDITITDAEAEHVITVDDYYQLILSKLGECSSNKCLTAVTFYLLRCALAEEIGVERRSIKRHTNLQELIPIEKRKALWQKLSTDLALQLPAFTRSEFLNNLLVAIPLTFIGTSIIISLLGWVENWQAYLLAFSGFFATYLLAVVTRPLKQHFSSNVSDMDGMTRQVLMINLTKISNENGGLNHGEVYALVLDLISQQLGIPVPEIERHHSFVDDLGVD